MTAIVRNQFPLIEVIETGEKVPTTRPDAAMAIGTLENGALFSIQSKARNITATKSLDFSGSRVGGGLRTAIRQRQLLLPYHERIAASLRPINAELGDQERSRYAWSLIDFAVFVAEQSANTFAFE